MFVSNYLKTIFLKMNIFLFAGSRWVEMTAETWPLSPPKGEAKRSYDQEHAQMEAWLDDHTDFVHDYFIR